MTTQSFQQILQIITNFLFKAGVDGAPATGLIPEMGNFLENFVLANPILVIFVLIAFSRGIIGIVKRWLPGRV